MTTVKQKSKPDVQNSKIVWKKTAFWKYKDKPLLDQDRMMAMNLLILAKNSINENYVFANSCYIVSLSIYKHILESKLNV